MGRNQSTVGRIARCFTAPQHPCPAAPCPTSPTASSATAPPAAHDGTRLAGITGSGPRGQRRHLRARSPASPIGTTVAGQYVGENSTCFAQLTSCAPIGHVNGRHDGSWGVAFGSLRRRFPSDCLRAGEAPGGEARRRPEL